MASNIEWSLNNELETVRNEAGVLRVSPRTCLGEMITFLKSLMQVGVGFIMKDQIYKEEFDLIFLAVITDFMYCLNVYKIQY